MSKHNEFQQHKDSDNKVSPIADYIKEIVYGGNDGIVTTFAVVSGFSGASLTNSESLTLTFTTVLLFGLANLFADGLSMGLGDFLSSRAEKDVYKFQHEKETHEIEATPDMERFETIEILEEKGFTKDDAEVITERFAKNKHFWANWMVDNELGLTDKQDESDATKAVTTFFSFIIFGFIPLIPYLVLNTSTSRAFLGSSLATATALIILGILKWKVSGGKILRSVAEILFVGGIAAVVAFVVGILIKA